MLRMRYNLFRGGSDAARKRATAPQYQRGQGYPRSLDAPAGGDHPPGLGGFPGDRHAVTPARAPGEGSTATRNAYAKQFNIGQRTLLDLLNSENEVLRGAPVRGGNAQRSSARAVPRARGDGRTDGPPGRRPGTGVRAQRDRSMPGAHRCPASGSSVIPTAAKASHGDRHAALRLAMTEQRMPVIPSVAKLPPSSAGSQDVAGQVLVFGQLAEVLST